VSDLGRLSRMVNPNASAGLSSGDRGAFPGASSRMWNGAAGSCGSPTRTVHSRTAKSRWNACRRIGQQIFDGRLGLAEGLEPYCGLVDLWWSSGASILDPGMVA
jgi:hypothetical protein